MEIKVATWICIVFICALFSCTSIKSTPGTYLGENNHALLQEELSKRVPLNLIVVIDNEICEDIIGGEFVVKNKSNKPIDLMAFRAWGGSLQMIKSDYKKIFSMKPDDTLYLNFKNNNYKLDTDYTYEAKIPRGMINDKYLILKFYNKKNKQSREKYLFPENKDYVVQVNSPGYNTLLNINIK